MIDEYSMLGQVTFGWIDRRLKQSCGDPFQLPPVADKPFYHAIPTNSIGEQGYLTYMMFHNVVKRNVNKRVQRINPEQTRFRQLLLRLRKGESTVDDWKLLLTRQPSNNINNFENAHWSGLRPFLRPINFVFRKSLFSIYIFTIFQNFGGSLELYPMCTIAPTLYLVPLIITHRVLQNNVEISISNMNK